MPVLLRRFCRDREGATAIEYCLIAGFIALAIFGGLTPIGPKLNRYFMQVSSGLN